MKTITQETAIASIGKIYDESKRCKLEKSFFTKIDKELKFLSKYFGTTKNQAFIMSLVFALNYKGDMVDISTLIDHLDCNPTEIVNYENDFKKLVSLGILQKQKMRLRFKLTQRNSQYILNKKISDAIINNTPAPKINNNKVGDVFELLEKIDQLGEQRNDDDISTEELFQRTKNLLSSNSNFILIKKIKELGLNTEDAFLYLNIIWKTLTDSESTEIEAVFENIYDNIINRVKYIQNILSKENKLVKSDLITSVESRFFDTTRLKLTEHSCELLKECNIRVGNNEKKIKNVISPVDIPLRKLFFNETEMKQLFELKHLLSKDKFQEFQKRMSNRKRSAGCTALLHGAPGTGKTEFVKQIARETKRQLMKVEISQSKSMWYGESEKIIKRIFSDYYEFSKKCDHTPILFLNEADAIISARRAIGSSNLTQTENSIQNIILEELENFEGILIATTNLVRNLDSAFERRFLFKILFQKPDIAIRTEIWKANIPDLSIDEYEILAKNYNFSGAQIENIFLKTEIQEIVSGKKATLKDLEAFCEEETLIKERIRVGFN